MKLLGVLMNKKNDLELQIPPQETFTNLVFLLNLISPVKIKDVSSFAKIALGQQKKYHNWQLIAIEIYWDLI